MSNYHNARLLLALVRNRWDEAESLARGGAPDAESFVAACVEADVHPWVHALLERNDRFSLVGSDVRERLERLRSKVRQDNLLLLARAEQSLKILRDADVTPIALKGLDLLHRLYDRFDERTMDDVDLLVRPEDLRRTIDGLVAAGWTLPPGQTTTHFVRSSHHLPISGPAPLPVEFEIHWNLAQEERLGIDPAAIFDRALPLEISGLPALRMDDHDLVAHLLVHHFSHYFDRRLKWLVDLQRIAAQPAFNWETAAERIRSWEAVVTAGISLRHLHRLDPDLIPTEALRALPVAGWRRALVAPLRSRHPQEMYRWAGKRAVRMYLATVFLEKPGMLPSWLLHRRRRDHVPTDHPLDRPGQ